MPPGEKAREGYVPEEMQEALARLGVLCCRNAGLAAPCFSLPVSS